MSLGERDVLPCYRNRADIIIINIIITIVIITALSSSAKARAVLRAISDVVLQHHSVARMKVRNAIQCTFIDELRGSVG